MSPNYQDIDVLLTDLAAASAHRNLKQAAFDKLEALRKRKKGGWSMKKCNAASDALAAANVAVNELKACLSELQARETEGGNAEGIDSEVDTDHRRKADGDGRHGRTLKARLGELQATGTKGAEGTNSEVHKDNRRKADGDGQHGQASRAVPAGEAPLTEDSDSQEAMSRKAANQNGGEEVSLAKDSGAQEAISNKAGIGEAHEPVHPANALDKITMSVHKTNEIDTLGEPANPETQTFGTSDKGHEDGESGAADYSKLAGIAEDSASGEVGDESTAELADQDMDALQTFGTSGKGHEDESGDADDGKTASGEGGDKSSGEGGDKSTGELADKDMVASGSTEMNQDRREASAAVEHGMSDGTEKRKRKREKITRGAEDRMTSDNEEADMKRLKREVRKDVQKTTKKEEGEPKEEEDEISKAVKENILHPHRTLKTTVRTKIRSNQTIAPEAATTYRCIALDVLTTNRGNVLCPYHQEMDKKKAPQDSKYMITGVPLPRMAAETKKEAKTAEFRERLDSGFLHCGCETDAALWDFYFWKTLKMTEEIDGKDVTEHVPRWTPRDRAFILKLFQEYTFLTVDDLYSRGKNPEWHRETMLTAQVERMLASINELREKRGVGTQVLQLADKAESNSDDDGTDGL